MIFVIISYLLLVGLERQFGNNLHQKGIKMNIFPYILREHEKLKKSEQYQQWIYAAGSIYDACGAIRSCIK